MANDKAKPRCPKCGVELHQMLFMGIQPDGYVCSKCRTYFSPERKPLAVIL